MAIFARIRTGHIRTSGEETRALIKASQASELSNGDNVPGEGIRHS